MRADICVILHATVRFFDFSIIIISIKMVAETLFTFTLGKGAAIAPRLK